MKVWKIQTTGGTGRRLQVEFCWSGKLLVHTVSLQTADGQQVAWQAMPAQEGQEGQPVFQEIHEQPSAVGESILFLSGAGNGVHWSMSVEATTPGQLTFDVAARISRPPTPQAIRYQLSGKEATEGTKKFTPTLPETIVQAKGVELTLQQTNAEELALPGTLRWKYCVG